MKNEVAEMIELSQGTKVVRLTVDHELGTVTGSKWVNRGETIVAGTITAKTLAGARKQAERWLNV